MGIEEQLCTTFIRQMFFVLHRTNNIISGAIGKVSCLLLKSSMILSHVDDEQC